jgi:hypothetical protein
MPFTDMAMVEGRWPATRRGEEERFWRATAYHKLWRYWVDNTGWYSAPADQASVMRQFRNGLAQAIFPSLEAIQSSSHNLESYRAAYRQYVPALEELSAAGWEPVPYATATEGVIVERFGSFAEGTLHLTLRNYATAPKEVVLHPDRQGLGVPPKADLVYTNLLPGTPTVADLPEEGLKAQVEADGSRAFWIGTRQQAAARGFRLARYTLGKIERLFATELDATSRKTVEDAKAIAKQGMAIEGGALSRAELMQSQADRLQQDLKTNSPLDLAKLIFQLRTQVSLAPAALLHLQAGAPRLVEGALRGQSVSVPWTMPDPKWAKPSESGILFMSPWPEVAAKCTVLNAQTIGLSVPAEPQRELLPYLVVYQVRRGRERFTVCTPVDVTLGEAVQVALEPAQVTRGADIAVKVVLSSRLKEAATVRLTLTPPQLVKVNPAKLTVALPAEGRAEAPLTLTLERGVRLGDLWLGYAITSDQAQFAGKGMVSVKVTEAATGR